MIPTTDSLASLFPVAVLLAKVTVISALILLAGWLGGHISAARRHLLYLGAVLVLLALPLATLFMRSVPVPVAPVVVHQAFSRTVDVGSIASLPPHDVARTSHDTPRANRFVQLVPVSLAAIWLFGLMVSLLRMLSAARDTHRLRQSGEVWPDGQSVADTIAANAGIRRPVVVRCHDAAPGPMAAGIWRPSIIMPSGAREWSEKQIHRAVTHELEHVRRLDALSQLLARTACALYWFHPLVWRVASRLRLEAERACDDAVVRHDDPAEYASLLVDVAARQSGSSSRHAMVAMAHRADLSIRVTAILDTGQSRQAVRTRWATMAVCAAIASTALLAPLTVAAEATQAASAHVDAATGATQAKTTVFRFKPATPSLPAITSACQQPMSSPVAQPPVGSAPVLLSLEGCFGPWGSVSKAPWRPVDVYMNAIRLPRLVSQPSQGKWTSFTPDVERVIQDDIARTRRLDGVENASAEVNDYVFPNGVVGKSIVYRVIERDQRATGAAPQPAQGADGASQSRFVRTDLVLVDVTVKDAQGQPVEGLLATDFRVTEDNVERAVEMFEYRSLPAGSYYLLGFRQANSVPNGKFRRISVQVNRPGVRVENRQGYYANRDDFSRDTYAEDMPGVVAPIVRERREPIYPAAAATGRIQGSVVVEAVVGIDGRVIRARVATPFDPKYGLDEAAVQAVQAWTFTPGEFNGMKVPVLTRVVVSFQLH